LRQKLYKIGYLGGPTSLLYGPEKTKNIIAETLLQKQMFASLAATETCCGREFYFLETRSETNNKGLAKLGDIALETLSFDCFFFG